jgi:uncharacterized membrane-anchored protein YitT (DUF2179 family)
VKPESTGKQFSNVLFLIAGIIVANIGLTGFLLPNHFIDGGVTGISMLLAALTKFPLAVMLVLVNAPFVLVGYWYVGKMFALKSSLAIILLAACIALIPCPEATHDKLLGAVFGGFFIGAGVGLAIRGGGVLDGTEILAVVLSRRTLATVGEMILGLNIVIFSIAAFFLGIESALYSVLTYFSAFKTIDFLLHGIESYHAVMIMSAQHEAIRQDILSQLGRGVTEFTAKGGFTEVERQVLYCVITRLEVSKMHTIIQSHDENAFVVLSPVLDIHGGVVKRRAFH